MLPITTSSIVIGEIKECNDLNEYSKILYNNDNIKCYEHERRANVNKYLKRFHIEEINESVNFLTIKFRDCLENFKSIYLVFYFIF
jgi:hypothetical protein